MTSYCPQCGSKIMHGATKCMQCGLVLQFVAHSNAKNNDADIPGRIGMSRRSASNITAPMMAIDINNSVADSTITMRYNEDAHEITQPASLEDDGMIITGMPDEFADPSEFDTEVEISQEINKTNEVLGSTIANHTAHTAGAAGEMSRYKIITQVYDKKLGFNAAELEQKLNLYANMGYHIIPNTTICQPGQDFFAMMERNIEPHAENHKTANNKDNEDKK